MGVAPRVVALLFAGLVSQTAVAQPAPPVRVREAPAAHPVQTVDFESGSALTAERKKPTGTHLTARRQTRFESLLRTRIDFHDALRRSADAL